jgi:hypothetical protein
MPTLNTWLCEEWYRWRKRFSRISVQRLRMDSFCIDRPIYESKRQGGFQRARLFPASTFTTIGLSQGGRIGSFSAASGGVRGDYAMGLDAIVKMSMRDHCKEREATVIVAGFSP